jgi:hypothetical protein
MIGTVLGPGGKMIKEIQEDSELLSDADLDDVESKELDAMEKDNKKGTYQQSIIDFENI